MTKIWKQAMEYWKAKPTTAQYNNWLKEMQRYDYFIISQGLEILKREKRFFPTISEWLAVTDSIWDTKHDREFERINRDAKDFWSKPANDWKLLIALLKKEITRGEFLNQMKVKGVNVSELENYYQKSDLPLNMQAGTQNIKNCIPKKYRDWAITGGRHESV